MATFAWYNIQADLPVLLPPILSVNTGQPPAPADLAPLFPMSLIEQERDRNQLGCFAAGLPSVS